MADLDDSPYSNPESMLRMMGMGQPGGMPMPQIVEPTQVRREALTRSTNICASYAILVKILERHETTIQKRWTKKKRQDRLKILLGAWPKMATSHRPDFDAFRKESSRQRQAGGTRYRDCYLWPHVNQEDLLKTKTLLLLLNSRGRHPPSAFAAADGEAVQFGHVTQAVPPLFLNEHIMMLNGVDADPEEYGKLLNWDDHDDAFDWMHTQKQFLPGEGLLILEIQERLMAFLVNCCKAILHDINESGLTSDAHPIQPPPRLKTELEINGFDSLAVLASEAPYRVPAELDFERIESLLTAKADAFRDHMWSLREDPSYYADCIMEARDHRQEMIKDTAGMAHPVFAKTRENVFWARVIGNVLTNAYMQPELFSELQNQAHNLRLLQAQYASAISPKENLPQEYLNALLKFRHYLKQGVQGQLGTLKQCVTASPPLRHLFVRQIPNDPTTSMLSIMSRPGANMTRIEREVMWILRVLLEDGQELFLCRLPRLVDELQRLIEAEPDAKRLISPTIAEVIGDLAILTECLRQLELYQPWANGFETALVEKKKGIMNEFAERAQPWAGMMSAFQESNLLAQPVRLGTLSDDKFVYPIDKRRTKENVDALRRAEANLDEFWRCIDQLMHDKAGNQQGSVISALLSEARTLQRTPAWVDATPSSIDTGIETLNKPMSELYFGLSSPEKGKPKASAILPLPKTKVKTRGTPHPTTEQADGDQGLERTEPDVQPTLHVDARTLKVFRTLFFVPSVSAAPGEVPWTDFLHAMTSTGFLAEKLYGSVWQFRPKRLDVDRSIQFHEPHPRAKIPYRTARRFGRRLNRAYGWRGNMFELAQK